MPWASPAGASGALEAAITKARNFERGNDYARAIDTYLDVSQQDSSNVDALAQCWQQAAGLAVMYQRHRAAEVVGLVASRLVAVGRPDAAAEAYESIDDVQGGWRHAVVTTSFETDICVYPLVT
jgi:hypothetical protein